MPSQMLEMGVPTRESATSIGRSSCATNAMRTARTCRTDVMLRYIASAQDDREASGTDRIALIEAVT